MDPAAGGGVGRLHAVGRHTALLDTGIHIGLIIIADKDRLVIPVNHAGQRGHADVNRTAIASEAHHVIILQSLCLRPCQNTGHRGGGRCEGRNHSIHKKRHMRIDKGHGGHTVGRDDRDRAFAQNLQGKTDR